MATTKLTLDEERLHFALVAAWFVREVDEYAKTATYRGELVTDRQYDAAMEEALYVAEEAIEAYRRVKDL